MPKIVKTICVIVALVFAAVLAYSSYHIFSIMNEYQRNDILYDDVREEVFRILRRPGDEKVSETEERPSADIDQPVYAEAEFEVEVDFVSLRARNPEAVAWLWIPDTDISYPIVQGIDNDKYLHYTFDGIQSVIGSIFLDYRNSAGFGDAHSVIYGHNMKNGSMFGQLSKFGDAEYLENHSYIHVITEEKFMTYRIFSQYIMTLNHDSYKMDFADAASFKEYLARLKAYSGYKAGFEPDYERIITLSTCVGDDSKRRIIHAGLISVIDN